MISCFFESPRGEIVGRFVFNEQLKEWESVPETPDFDEERILWQDFRLAAGFKRAKVSVEGIVPRGADMLFMWEMP